jgi:RHS repeat-associated protein
MLMPGRKFTAGTGYRYGFNGKEKDNSTGEENLDFGSRILDTRLGGRWLSLDPLMKKYPGESPYLFVGANPIIYIDPDGEDRILKIYEKRDGKTTLIRVATHKGEYVWGTASYNSNIHMKKNINQDVIIDYDKHTVTRSAAVIAGDQDGKGFDDLGYLWEKLTDGARERKGEGKSDRGGWTLTTTSRSGAGTDAGDVIKGKPSGSINVDYIGVITNIVASPDDVAEAVFNFGGAAIGITSTKDEAGRPYLPQGFIPESKDGDVPAANTNAEKLDLIPEIKTKKGDCSVCGVKGADSGHVNQTARDVNKNKINKVLKTE